MPLKSAKREIGDDIVIEGIMLYRQMSSQFWHAHTHIVECIRTWKAAGRHVV